MVTGIETTTAFLHSCKTFTRRWSISKMSATRRSCCRAIWKGFSRRWDSGASTVVTKAEYRSLLDRERDRADGRRARARRRRDETDAVAAGVEAVAVRVAAGEADRDAAGQQVAQSREQAEPLAAAPELDVQPGDRAHLRADRRRGNAAGLQREHGRRGGGGPEPGRRDGDRRDQVLPLPAEGDRPRQLQRSRAASDEQQRALGGAALRRGALQLRAEGHRRVTAGLQAHPARLRADRQPPGARVADPDEQRAGRDVADHHLLLGVPAVALRVAEGKRDRVGRDLAGGARTEIDQPGALPGHALAGD